MFMRNSEKVNTIKLPLTNKLNGRVNYEKVDENIVGLCYVVIHIHNQLCNYHAIDYKK